MALTWSAIKTKALAIWSRPIPLGWVVLGIPVCVIGWTYWSRIGAQPALPADAGEGIGLSSLVNTVRSELVALQTERLQAGHEAVFSIDSFDLEIAFVVKQSDKTKGTVDAQVVTLETESEAVRERSHRVTLHLKPLPTEEIRVPAGPTAPEGDIQMLPQVPLGRQSLSIPKESRK
jgi:hypothetical protein